MLLNIPLLPSRRKDSKDLPFHPANKNALGYWLLTRLVLRSLRRAFGGVYLYLHPEARSIKGMAEVPVIYCCTHGGWWDGYLSYIINESTLKRDGYLMMEEVHLATVPFMTWGGVFGIDRHDPRKALASIEYIIDILKTGTGKALCIFPQGTITHPDKRPLGLYGGVGNIVRRLPRCAVLPVAIRYEFLLEQAPDIFIRTGAPLLSDTQQGRLASSAVNAQIEQAMLTVADRLHDDVVEGNLQPYRRVLRGRGSVNRTWVKVRGMADRVRSLFGRGERESGPGL